MVRDDVSVTSRAAGRGCAREQQKQLRGWLMDGHDDRVVRFPRQRPQTLHDVQRVCRGQPTRWLVQEHQERRGEQPVAPDGQPTLFPAGERVDAIIGAVLQPQVRAAMIACGLLPGLQA